MPVTLNPPPPTPVEPVTEILHGVSITDPYRWLEDQNSPRTRKWLEEQGAYARAYLDAIPGRDRIRERVEELLAVELVSEPWKVGNRYFYLKRSPYQEQAVIMMREEDSEGDTLLIDPADKGEGNSTAVSILSISSEGNLLAYGVRHGGEDSQSIEFLDVDGKRVLPDRLSPGFNYGLVFSADGQGFYYSHEVPTSSRPHYRAVYFHRFGAAPNEDREIFFAGERDNLRVSIGGSASGMFMAYLVAESKDPATFRFYLQDLKLEKAPRSILEGTDSIFLPSFADNRLIALSNWKSPNLRIVEIDPAHPARDYWRDVVPESFLRIKDFAVVGKFVCVNYAEQLSNRLHVFDLTGHQYAKVPCPLQGTIRLLRRPIESDTLFYDFSSFDQPPTIFSYHIPSAEQRVWAQSSVMFEPSSFEIEHVRYKSIDGTQVPMFLVAREGQRSIGPGPTFLTGYGGFGASLTPQFNAYSTFLVEQGFLLAIAGLRGGGEFGEEWHSAGKRHNRQNAIDDFIAGAEWLLENKYSVPDKIAIGGGSNGGLLVGAALTQRPDLFRAVVCLGPLMDMLRYHLFDFANMWVAEFGKSEMEADFRHLLAYSPYHAVEEGVPYPAVLLVSGDADTRCNPMHARKMVARLQAATNSTRPILLDYKPKWGHAPLQPFTQRIDALTDRLAFICHELDMSI